MSTEHSNHRHIEVNVGGQQMVESEKSNAAVVNRRHDDGKSSTKKCIQHGCTSCLCLALLCLCFLFIILSGVYFKFSQAHDNGIDTEQVSFGTVFQAVLTKSSITKESYN